MKLIHFYPSKESILASTPALAISQHDLSQGQHTSWRTHSSVTVHVLCMQGVLRLDIDKPMFAANLVPGELYSLPPELAYRLSAAHGSAGFLAVVSGSQRDLEEVEVLHANREPFLRRAPAERTISREANIDKHFENYEAGYTRVDVLARTEQLRVLVLGLGERQCVPWHSHDHIEDTFFCMDGPMRIETREPESTQVLLPGETGRAAAGVPHFVSGIFGNACTFLIVQGVGQYNYVPFRTTLMGQPVQ
ncbi:cupin domain-containing protein [Caballeronia sp. INSB1]|uniref:cupin domain-containing protein n=1 Tax=Caballeronia sp. INSB1 TaxID=2921751 RepID=UPI002032F48B|nr:hypothetical protein [Caballeronia sp. INSB1]